MTETQRIAALLKTTFDGDAWHGPSVMAALKDVTAAQAATHPIPNAHSIWELVLHQTYWISVIEKGVRGEMVDIVEELNWPTIPDATEDAWKKTLADLRATYNNLIQTVRTLGDPDLDKEAIPGGISVYTVLHSIAHHNLYHAGQIVLLKKTLLSQHR